MARHDNDTRIGWLIMCGFTGYLVNPSKLCPDLPNRLRRATESLRHRGPDQAGEFFDEAGTVGMGFARLSIIDLSESGRQPMTNEDGSLVLTFNGEIYNYVELRADLVRRGHRFRSRTDSEVVLHLYEQHGADMLKRLDGMYAFVIYDCNRKEIFAARDRFGKKPFYYAYTASGLYWASEFRALVRLVPEELHEDLQGFYHYVTFNCYPREYTFYREIRKLLPGHSLQFSLNKPNVKIQRYYRLGLHENSDSLQERDERIRTLFASAVKKRLMSDVPIGFFLSGGIDSSAIVMQASQFQSDINTFSIALEGDPLELDETPYARLIAQRSGAKHYEARLTEREYAELILQTAWALDEPLNLPDAALLNHLSRLAASVGVKVLLSGEGSDEVFFGYTFYWPRIQHYYKHLARYDRIPTAFRDAAKSILHAIAPHRFSGLQHRLNARDFLMEANLGLGDIQKHNCLAERVVKDRDVREWSETMSARLKRDLGISDQNYFFKQVMLHEFNLRLPDLLLMRVDKVTMANSVETRCPFLDRDLVEYATGIPFDDLYDGRLGKVALRRALADLLPYEIIGRGKVGFGGGDRNMTKPIIATLLRDVIAESGFLKDYYAPAYLDSLVQKSPAERSYEDWNVATFAIWRQQLNDELARQGARRR